MLLRLQLQNNSALAAEVNW